MLKSENISVSINGKLILNEINLHLKEGEVLSIIGENGAGKSTLLKSLLGVQQLSSGKVFFQNELVPPPEEELIPGIKQIGYVSQGLNFERFLTVKDNLNYELPKISQSIRRAKIQEVATDCEIVHLLNRKIDKLSGGEKQRVTLAKAIIRDSLVYFLDEPYSHLDRPNELLMKRAIDRLKEKKKSIIMVTHDLEEALHISDKIIVLNKGIIEQTGSPEDLYEKPCSFYVANLVHQMILTTDGFQVAIKDVNVEKNEDGEGIIEKVFQTKPQGGKVIIRWNGQSFYYHTSLSLDKGDRVSITMEDSCKW
jgi:ABC-type sugar transport system ATPase subunit